MAERDRTDEFYVGYLPQAPRGIGTRTRVAVAAVFELPPAEARGFRFAMGERVSPGASPPSPPPSGE